MRGRWLRSRPLISVVPVSPPLVLEQVDKLRTSLITHLQTPLTVGSTLVCRRKLTPTSSLLQPRLTRQEGMALQAGFVEVPGSSRPQLPTRPLRLRPTESVETVFERECRTDQRS